MVIKGDFIPDLFTRFASFRVVGVNLFTFIFVRPDVSQELINHEKIHSAQYRETLYIGFPVIYLVEYFINYLKLRDSYKAYRNIRFEKEAYWNQKNFYYLSNRKLYAWRKL